MSGGIISRGQVGAGAFVSGGIADYWLPVPINWALSGAEQDTGIDLPANAFVLDVLLYTQVAEVTGSTKTMNVGILSTESGGDFDGFMAGIWCGTVGFRRPKAQFTPGGNETYLSSSERGAFITPIFLAGSNTVGDVGTLYEAPFSTASITGKSISVTPIGSPFTEFRGTLFFRMLSLGG